MSLYPFVVCFFFNDQYFGLIVLNWEGNINYDMRSYGRI